MTRVCQYCRQMTAPNDKCCPAEFIRQQYVLDLTEKLNGGRDVIRYGFFVPPNEVEDDN